MKDVVICELLDLQKKLLALTHNGLRYLV
jgi:hypothetical protein